MLSRDRRHVIKLVVTIIITTAFFGVELVYGHLTKSLALISDSYNMLSNILSMFLGLACIWLSSKESKKSTFGWARAEITGALINAVFLVALCFTILTESIERLIFPEKIKQEMTLLIVGIVGLVVNFIGLLLFFNETFGDVCSRKKTADVDQGVGNSGYGDSTKDDAPISNEVGVPNGTNTSDVQIDIDDDDLEFSWRKKKTKKLKTGSEMNIQGVFLHILGDALGSVVVVVSALVVMFCEGDWKYLVDPALSIITVILVVIGTLPLIKQTSFILLQHLPGHMVVPEMVEELNHRVKDLRGVHEFHIWQLVGNRMIASLHIRCSNMQEYLIVTKRLKSFFHQSGIHSLTVQPEFINEEDAVQRSESVCSTGCNENCPNDASFPVKTYFNSLDGSPMDKSIHEDEVFSNDVAFKKEINRNGSMFSVQPTSPTPQATSKGLSGVASCWNEGADGMEKF